MKKNILVLSGSAKSDSDLMAEALINGAISVRNKGKESEYYERAPMEEKVNVLDVEETVYGFSLGPLIISIPDTKYIGEEKYYNYKDNNVYGKPLLEGIAKQESGFFTGICIPCGSGTFTHKYISCHSNPMENVVSYTLPSGKYAVFDYEGFHNLDENGIHKLRKLMYIAISSWALKNDVNWKEHFVEIVNFDFIKKNHVEVDVMVPLL